LCSQQQLQTYKKELERSQQDLEQSRAANAAPGMAEQLGNANSVADHKSREAEQLKVRATSGRSGGQVL